MATIGTLAVNIVAKTGHFTKGITSSQRMLGRFGMAAGAAAAAATGLGVAMLRTSETINRAMTKSTAIMGDLSDSMRKDMLKAANDVAKVTEFSTAQAAEGYFYLASAGLSAKDSLAALPIVSRFAQAGNFDLAKATELAMDSQAALGLTSADTAENLENLTRVTDVLVKGNILANTSTEQLASALSSGAAGALKLVNKEMEEGVAVLAAYAAQGIKGEKAGTAFAVVMRDLQTKAIENRSAFRAAGVEVFNATGKMQNMADIVGDLENLLAGASDEQKKMTLMTLGFSGESSKYLQSLLGMSDKIREYEKALRNAGGAAAEVAGKSMTDLQRATAQLGGAWDQLSLSIGNAAEKLGLFKAASEGAEGMAILLNNALNGDKKDKTSIDTLQTITGDMRDPITGMNWNPLSTQRKATEWAMNKMGLMTNDVGPANPQWAQDRNAELAAAGGNAGGVNAQQTAKVFGKWFANGLASAQGTMRRGALAGDNALSSIEGMKDAADKALLQRRLGELTFGMMGTKVESKAAQKAAEMAEAQKPYMRSNTLSFARTGSRESYEQRMRIGKQNEADKIRKQQLKKLDNIDKNIAKLKPMKTASV